MNEPTEAALELSTLIDMALAAKAAGARDVEHMDAPAGAFNYIRVADVISGDCKRETIASPVLDWGCGYGQVSWLLRRRGVDVVSCDVEVRPARETMEVFRSLSIDHLTDSFRLPYDRESFGTVLSMGVLEHVEDLENSLREINRILRPSGLFLVFMLPNRFSWAEWVADLRHISVHPRKFTFRETKSILEAHGFRIEKGWRHNVLPRNLTGFPAAAKAVYGRFYRQIEVTDSLLSRYTPFSLFSGVIEIVCRKTRSTTVLQARK